MLYVTSFPLFIALILCFSILCCVSAQNGCSLKMPTDLPKSEPVLLYADSLSPSSYSLYKPVGQTNVLPIDSRLKLLCTGTGNLISAIGQQSVELSCRANGKFATVVGNTEYALNQLGCSSIPTSSLRLTSEPCSNGQGFIFEAGFEINSNEFAKVFTICYNNATENTYYTHNEINGATIDYAVVESDRRAFRANGMRFTTTATNNFYTQKNQLARFELYFGPSQPFISTNSYLARGHMAPDADFIFSYEQLATYFYTNVAPEFQAVNAGNWLRVENLARSLASSFGDNLDIYTGSMGILRLSSGSFQNVAIYLDSGNYIEVPQYYFKVIRHAATNAAVVILTVNNPFATTADIIELCPNVCSRAGLADSRFSDTTIGYTYCCELAAFKQLYADLPNDLTAANLLNEV